MWITKIFIPHENFTNEINDYSENIPHGKRAIINVTYHKIFGMLQFSIKP